MIWFAILRCRRIAYTLKVKTLSCGFQPGRPWGSSPKQSTNPRQFMRGVSSSRLALVGSKGRIWFQDVLWYPNGIPEVPGGLKALCYLDRLKLCCTEFFLLVNSSSGIVATDMLQLVQHSNTCWQELIAVQCLEASFMWGLIRSCIGPAITSGNLQLVYLVGFSNSQPSSDMCAFSFPIIVKQCVNKFVASSGSSYMSTSHPSDICQLRDYIKKESAIAGNSCANDEPKNSWFWWDLLWGSRVVLTWTTGGVFLNFLWTLAVWWKMQIEQMEFEIWPFFGGFGVGICFIPYDLWPFLIWRHVHSELDGQAFNSHIGRFPYLQMRNHLSVCFFVSPNLWMCFVGVAFSFGSHFLLWNPQKYFFLSDSNRKDSPICSLGLEISGDLPYIQCHFVGAQKNVDNKEKARHHLLWGGKLMEKPSSMCVWEMERWGMLYACFRRPSWNIKRIVVVVCLYFSINLFLQLNLLISRFTCHTRMFS